MRIHGSELGLKIFLFFAGFLVLSVFCSAQMDFNMQEKQTIERFKRANSSFLEGLKKFEKGDLTKAGKLFKECVAICPEHADAYFYLAQIDYKAGALDVALQDIEAALKNSYEMGKFQISQRESLLRMLRDERRTQEEKKSKLEGERSQIESTGTITEKFELDRAIVAANNEISILDSRLRDEQKPPVIVIPARYYYVKGNICFKLKRYDDSIRLYREAIKSDPKYEGAYNNLANLFYMFRKYEEALNTITAAESNGVKVNQNLKDVILKALGR
jgi:tetratricopeptide (TPR) repeat protein